MPIENAFNVQSDMKNRQILDNNILKLTKNSFKCMYIVDTHDIVLYTQFLLKSTTTSQQSFVAYWTTTTTKFTIHNFIVYNLEKFAFYDLQRKYKT